MVALNFPQYSFRFRRHNNQNQIFDEVRKKWMVCTPEEWVRQNFICWLIYEKRYPASNIVIEGGLKLNSLQKRTDVLAYKNGNPWLLVECKAPEIKVSQKTFDQLFRYNSKINAPLLAVTNGITHFFAWQEDFNASPIYLENLPLYHQELSN